MTISEYYHGAILLLGWIALNGLMICATVIAHFRFKVRRILKKNERLSRIDAEARYDPGFWLFAIIIIEVMLVVIPSLLLVVNNLM